jgi:hypothetical protein
VKRLLFFGLIGLTVVALGACTETGIPTRASSVQVSFATRATGAPAMQRVGLQDDTLVIGDDTLVLTSVAVVLREIELRLATTPDCPGTDDDEGCEKFEVGPVLVSLPLAPGAEQAFEADVPAGTYAQVEFEIHKPDDGDPDDQVFLQQHPEFNGVSIRVEGVFNGVPFVHTTELDVEQELQLIPNLVVAEGDSTNLTIFVDVSTWYVISGVLVDPATADKGGPNESAVNNAIKDSFKAFEDDDRSGSDD